MQLKHLGSSLAAWLSAAMIIVVGIAYIVSAVSTVETTKLQAKENKEEIGVIAREQIIIKSDVTKLTEKMDNTIKSVDRLTDKTEKLVDLMLEDKK